MPAIPVLAAGLVRRLDGVVVVVVEVLGAAGPADRQGRQVVERCRDASVLGVAEQLQRQDARGRRLRPDARSAVAETRALFSTGTALHILDRVLERLLPDGHARL